MTNNNKHHSQQHVFSPQSHTAIEQQFPTSGLVLAVQGTNGKHPAGVPRVSTLDVDSDISRNSARQPAASRGERPDQPRRQQPRVHPQQGSRPNTETLHHRLSGSNGDRFSHRRLVVTLEHFDSRQHAVFRTSREAPLDRDNSSRLEEPLQRPHRGVRQDKGVLTNASSASVQPPPDTKGIRVQLPNNGVVRSQNASAAKQKHGRLTLWGLDPALMSELERIAAEEGLSLSQVGKTGLGQWAHQRLHDQHEALLYPVLRQLIRDELRAFGNRIVFFLMRIAFAAEQTRILVTNILDRMLKTSGVEPQIFNSLVDQSSKMARRNIIARSPQIKSLMDEWFASLPDDSQETNRKEYPHG